VRSGADSMISDSLHASESHTREQNGRCQWQRFIPLLLFASVSLWLLLSVPPLWRDFDAMVQVTGRPDDMTILHYPALYPALSRAHVWVAEIISSLWQGKEWPEIAIHKGVRLNEAGIVALLVTQHLALMGALLYFVRAVCVSLTATIVVSLLLISNSSLFLAAHLVSSEALTTILCIALIGLGARIATAGNVSLVSAAVFYLSLTAAILTRHVNAVFAALLPLTFLAAAALRPNIPRMGRHQWLLRAAGFTLAGLLSIFAANGMTRMLCAAFDVEYRSTGFRSAAGNLGVIRDMPPAERDLLLPRLQTHTSDPVVKESILLLGNEAEAWLFYREAIEQILVRHGDASEGRELKARADRKMAEAVRLFYRHEPEAVLTQTLRNFRDAMARTTSADINDFQLRTAAWSVNLYGSNPKFREQTAGMKMFSPDAKKQIEQFSGSWYAKLWGGVPHGLFYLVSFVAAIAMWVAGAGRPMRILFVLSLLLTGLLITLATSAFTHYLPRLTSVTAICGYLALVILIAEGFAWRREKMKSAGT
jgi:hypothetical protein